jgi:glycosyltransferase involved in cell wall biosynthesis
MIEVSVIIPVRNQKDILMAALNSLRQQIKQPRVFEIVVCDDGSTDGVGDMIKRLRFPIFFKYFANNPSLGRAANRNLGFERSSGQHLIFIDGDMIPAPSFIDSILTDINQDIVVLGDVKPPTGEKLAPFDNYLYTRGRYNQSYHSTNIPARMFTSNNFYINRELFARVGGFDSAFQGWGGEDIDFGLRLEALGIPIKIAKEAITYHHHKKTLSASTREFYEFGNSMFAYLICKHPDFLKQLPTALLGFKKAGENILSLQRILSLLTINKPALKTTEFAVALMNNYQWPDIIYDYLLWGNLAHGYKRRKHS